MTSTPPPSLDSAADRTSRRSVLVTGAAGTIGRATVTRLASTGWRVVAFALEGDDIPDAADQTIFGDATKEDDIARALDGVDAVVHLAALPHWASGTPYEVYTTNVVATFNVLAQAAQRGLRRAVIASSIHASGIPGNHAPDLRPYYPIDESLPLAHDDWYSLSKYVDECTAAMVNSRWDLPVIALRFPLVGTLETLLAVAREWNAQPEEGVRLGWSYLDVHDAAEAIRLGLEATADGANVIQLATPHTLMNRPTEALLDEYAPDAERRSAFPGRRAPVDTSRAQRILGFHPEHEIDPRLIDELPTDREPLHETGAVR